VTGKRVSVWSADKKSPEMDKMGPASKERTMEVLKGEVSMRLCACLVTNL
jgi:SCY1-like protein 2